MSTESVKKEEYERYSLVLENSKDEVSRILLTHLYLEHLLERCIDSRVAQSKRLFGKDGLSFIQKLNLLSSFGHLDEQLYDGMKKINKIRNGMAHEFGFKVSPKSIEDLGRTLGKGYSDIKNNSKPDEEAIFPRILSRLCGKMARFASDAENGQT